MSKKTQNLLANLAKEYPHPRYAFLPEVRGGTGWSRESRADALAMDTWPSGSLELIGFELKTSRADWLRELKQPKKCEPMKQFCDRWYLVTSEAYSIARPEEVPKDWGYMCSDYMGKMKVQKEAPKLDSEPIDRLLLASILRLATKPLDEIFIKGRKYVLYDTLNP